MATLFCRQSGAILLFGLVVVSYITCKVRIIKIPFLQGCSENNILEIVLKSYYVPHGIIDIIFFFFVV